MSNENTITRALKSNSHSIILSNCTDFDEIVAISSKELNISREDVYPFDPTLENFEVLKELKKSFSIPPNASEYKLFIIKNSDELTKEMANSLLKISEEPPAYLKIIMLAKNEKRIIETIRSRSQIYFLGLKAGEATQMLEFLSCGNFKSWIDYLKQKDDFRADIESALVQIKKNGLNKSRKMYIDLSELFVKFENTNVNQKLHLENLFISHNFK